MNKYQSIHPQHPVTAVASFLCSLATSLSHTPRTDKRKKDLLILRKPQRLPREDKRAQKRPDKYTYDNIPVEIHRKQHDEIRNSELQHVQCCADELFNERWADYPTSVFSSQSLRLCMRLWLSCDGCCGCFGILALVQVLRLLLLV